MRLARDEFLFCSAFAGQVIRTSSFHLDLKAGTLHNDKGLARLCSTASRQSQPDRLVTGARLTVLVAGIWPRLVARARLMDLIANIRHQLVAGGRLTAVVMGTKPRLVAGGRQSVPTATVRQTGPYTHFGR